MKRLLAAGLIGAALLGPVLAQNAPAPESSPPGPSSPAGGTAPFLTIPPTELMVSNLIDLTVYNEQNQRIGEVEDLIMDGVRGVRAVIVSLGPPQGSGGERHVAVDPAALEVVRAGNGSYHAVLHATADQIKAAPDFKYRGAWSE